VSARDRALVAALAGACGRRVAAAPERTVGGSFDACHRWPTAAAPLFVKLAPPAVAARFAAEAAGLEALAASGAVRVPRVIGHGTTEDSAWLALEWLELEPPDAHAERALGQALAALHRTGAAAFGFAADNFIGATPQPNGWLADGVEFLIRRRLGHQLGLAARNGHSRRLAARGVRLLGAVATLHEGYRPLPALLHGDLWAGNRAMLADGTPVLFDPAVYFGDPEAELAMTRLFGGFGPEFYAAYAAAHPPAPGAAAREGLHRLYHVLNHLNLFGSGYLGAAEALIDRLLAAAGA
jgi:protein-ribulosamine 3-kinase